MDPWARPVNRQVGLDVQVRFLYLPSDQKYNSWCVSHFEAWSPIPLVKSWLLGEKMSTVAPTPWTLWIWGLNHLDYSKLYLLVRLHHYYYKKVSKFKQNYYIPNRKLYLPILWVSNFSGNAFQLPIKLSQHTQLVLDNKVYVLGGGGSRLWNKLVYQ